MKYRKILSLCIVMGIAVNFISCGKAQSSGNDDTEITKESSSEKDETLDDSKCKDIVKDWHDKEKEYSKNNDYDSFKNLYASDISDDTVKNDFEAFKNEKDFESYEYSIDFKTENVIGASYILYTNIKSENGDTHNQKSEARIYLQKEDGVWKFSNNEDVNKAYKDSFVPKLQNIYGEDYINKGYCNASYQIIHDKVIINNVGVEVAKCKKNDDGTVNLTLAIENGLDNDIFDIQFCDNSTVYSGDNKELCCIDNLKIDSNEICQSQKIMYVNLTLNKNDLKMDPANIDTSSMSIKNNIRYQNRQK